VASFTAVQAKQCITFFSPAAPKAGNIKGSAAQAVRQIIRHKFILFISWKVSFADRILAERLKCERT
jgi:hypothetical protein